MSNTKLIIRVPGSCITFNLIEVSRVKKKGQVVCVKREEGDNCIANRKKGEEVVSERWRNDDDDNYLIIRLRYSNGYPWLVIHHGVFEAVKAPLYVPIVKTLTKEKVVTMFLRDSANRGESRYIQQKFYLQFATIAEAEAFKTAHNVMLEEFRKEKKEHVPTCKVGLGKKQEEKEKKTDDGTIKHMEQPKSNKKQRMNKEVNEETKRHCRGSKDDMDEAIEADPATNDQNEILVDFLNGDAFSDIPDTQPLFQDDSE